MNTPTSQPTYDRPMSPSVSVHPALGHRPSISLAPVPSSALVTSPTTSSHINRSGTLANPSDAVACPANQVTSISDPATSSWIPPLRSISTVRGLLLAETGDAMVELDIYAQPGASGCHVGQTIVQGPLPPGTSSLPTAESPPFEAGKEIWREDIQDKVSRSGTWMSRRGTIKGRRKHGNDSLSPHGVGLFTSDTLLQISAPPHKSTSELRALLGNSAFRLKRNASVLPPPSLDRALSSGAPSSVGSDEMSPEALALEKAKPYARVEMDIILESETCIQGSSLKGSVMIHVRKNANKKQNAPILLSKAKIRVVGYEAIPHGNTRCTFYQCTALLSHVALAWDSVLASPPDADGWAEAKEGIHTLPFSLNLPADATCGTSKGILDVHSGVAIRYFAMASLRLKDPDTSAESVAHFYRSCEVWPRMSFSSMLSPAPRPLVSEAVKTVFMGGSGKVRLTAMMHRLYWVAGQRCAIHLRVVNESKKTVKEASITLLRTTTVFKPLGERKGNIDTDPDACETATMTKVVAGSVLVMGQKCAKGYASAKGWWTGVRSGDTADFVHHIVLPPDALSVTRVRLLEVEYTLNVNVTTGGLSSDVEVTLPISIINFLSIDSPPKSPISHLDGRLRVKPQFGRSETWYCKSRYSDIAGESMPGMKYTGTDMTVVAQEGDIASDFSQAAASGSGGSPSASDSTSTITQRLSVAVTLDEIDRAIGADSRVHDFAVGVGQVMGTRSVGSQFGPPGPRGQRLTSLPEAMPRLESQEESTSPKPSRSNTLPHRISERVREGKESVRPFVGRQPGMTRTSSMVLVKTSRDEHLQGTGPSQTY